MENNGLEKKPSDKSFKIGRWVVSPGLNTIHSGDEEVTLVPRVMELLVCLAQKSPHPVSQDELFETIWPNQVVSDSSLYQAVAQLRKSLGDTDKTKQYVERISGKGYRLIKPVEDCLNEEQASISSQLAPEPATIQNESPFAQREQPQKDNPQANRRSTQRNTVIMGLGVLTVLVASFFIYFGLSPNHDANPRTERRVSSNDFDLKQARSIALIRLETNQVQSDYQSRLDAFNDVLLTQLGLASGIKVVSLNQRLDEPAVDLYLAGKILTEDKQVRLFLRLEKVSNQEVVWAKLFTGNMDSLFDLQDEVTRGLLGLLDKKQNNASFSQQTVNSKAFDQYLIARHLWEKRRAGSLIQAKEILEELRDKQTLFPLAAVALCETYHFLYLYSDWDLSQATERCRPLLDLALEREPNLGQALAAKALLLSSSGDRDGAKLTFEKAIQLSPNYALAYLWYGNLLRNQGQYQRALRMSKKAYELAPMSPVINRSLAYSHLNLRGVKEAKYFYDRALALEPNYIHRAISDLDFFPLTFERASAFIVWADDNPRVFQRQSVYKLNLAQVWLALGELNKVEQIVAEFEENGLNPQFTLYVKASLQIQRGEFGAAAETFRQRLTLEMEKERVFVPYVQALDWSGNSKQAFEQYIDWFPELNKTELDVDDNNLLQLMFFIPLKRKIQPQWAWQELTERVDSKLAQRGYSPSLQVAEWLAYRGELESASNMLQKMMANGWLPDTNSEPFAFHRVRMLFEQVGLGAAEFEAALRENRERAISSLNE